MIPEASELEYLKWFYLNADFGPAHSDVMQALNEEFTQETKKAVPAAYEYE